MSRKFALFHPTLKMNCYLFLFSLCLLLFCLETAGQEITFDAPRPITYNELTHPAVPLVLENKRGYFIKHVYSDGGNYGGLLSKSRLSIGPELLSFYKKTELLSVEAQKQSAIIGIDTASQTAYYTNADPHSNTFEGLFAAQPHQRRAKKLSLPGFDAGDIHSFYLNAECNVLVFSTQHKGGRGNEDLYVSVRTNGDWAAPVSLGASINTSGTEISPFLSSDQKRLFFSSDGHEGYGQGDLFVSERLYDSWQVWSQPKNLGKEVNSDGYEAFPSIVGDTLAYFFSETGGQGKLWIAEVTGPSQRNPLRRDIDERSYLSEAEIQQWLGMAIDTTLSFIPDNLTFTRDSQELLWFIANQLVNNPEININISFSSHPADNRAKAKSVIVRNYLMNLGIDEQRITVQLIADSEDMPTKADATFNFFRLK